MHSPRPLYTPMGDAHGLGMHLILQFFSLKTGFKSSRSCSSWPVKRVSKVPKSSGMHSWPGILNWGSSLAVVGRHRPARTDPCHEIWPSGTRCATRHHRGGITLSDSDLVGKLGSRSLQLVRCINRDRALFLARLAKDAWHR